MLVFKEVKLEDSSLLICDSMIFDSDDGSSNIDSDPSSIFPASITEISDILLILDLLYSSAFLSATRFYKIEKDG